MPRRSPSFPCQHCGETVAAGARFCRACGADEQTWAEGADEAVAWSEPDDEFDYHDYLRREFSDDAAPRPPFDRIKKTILVLVLIAICTVLARTYCR